MEKLFKQQTELKSSAPGEQIEQQKKAAKVFRKLSSAAGSKLKESQNRYRTFCEAVTKEIRKTAMDVYPEIADLEPEQLREFKYLFVRDIQSMHERIEKLLSQSAKNA